MRCPLQKERQRLYVDLPHTSHTESLQHCSYHWSIGSWRFWTSKPQNATFDSALGKGKVVDSPSLVRVSNRTLRIFLLLYYVFVYQVHFLPPLLKFHNRVGSHCKYSRHAAEPPPHFCLPFLHFVNYLTAQRDR